MNKGIYKETIQWHLESGDPQMYIDDLIESYLVEAETDLRRDAECEYIDSGDFFNELEEFYDDDVLNNTTKEERVKAAREYINSNEFKGQLENTELITSNNVGRM